MNLALKFSVLFNVDSAAGGSGCGSMSVNQHPGRARKVAGGSDAEAHKVQDITETFEHVDILKDNDAPE